MNNEIPNFGRHLRFAYRIKSLDEIDLSFAAFQNSNRKTIAKISIISALIFWAVIELVYLLVIGLGYKVKQSPIDVQLIAIAFMGFIFLLVFVFLFAFGFFLWGKIKQLLEKCDFENLPASAILVYHTNPMGMIETLSLPRVIWLVGNDKYSLEFKECVSEDATGLDMETSARIYSSRTASGMIVRKFRYHSIKNVSRYSLKEFFDPEVRLLL